jgi:hypothetical protein
MGKYFSYLKVLLELAVWLVSVKTSELSKCVLDSSELP